MYHFDIIDSNLKFLVSFVQIADWMLKSLWKNISVITV